MVEESIDELRTRIKYLISFGAGLKNIGYGSSYTDAFLYASKIWLSANDPRMGFRRLVEAKQNGIADEFCEDATRGFDDAMRLFQEAKNL